MLETHIASLIYSVHFVRMLLVQLHGVVFKHMDSFAFYNYMVSVVAVIVYVRSVTMLAVEETLEFTCEVWGNIHGC